MMITTAASKLGHSSFELKRLILRENVSIFVKYKKFNVIHGFIVKIKKINDIFFPMCAYFLRMFINFPHVKLKDLSLFTL